MQWFRLYSEFLTDPKLITFTIPQRYGLIALMCLASESKERGVVLLDAEDIAGTLQMPEQEYQQFLAKLSRKGIAETREDGGLVIVNWLNRQYDNPSDQPKQAAERKHRMKEKGQNDTGTPQNDTGTPQNTLYSDSEDIQRVSDSPQSPPASASPAAKPQSSQVGVIEFVNAFRDKHGGEAPHVPDKSARALALLRENIGQAKYAEALTGFFVDPWAAENGHSVTVFAGSSVDRWRGAAAGQNGVRGSPRPSEKRTLSAAEQVAITERQLRTARGEIQ